MNARPSHLSTYIASIGIGLASFTALAAPAFAGDNLPPFDFSDEFYLANGIDPSSLIGRPNGTPPNSIIDNTPNGPNFNNVRILAHSAAYDHSGHPIFFYVTGLPTLASFLDNDAGEEALEIAETYKVYEFPRAANPLGAVFPKRQDLIADLRNGYFSNDPLGVWQINLIKFTPAAFNTSEGQDALAELAKDNGLDLDGTPIIRTISEVEDLLDEGFVSIFTPAANGSQGFRWFFCPVIEDPRDGAIAPDAHLEVTEGIPAAQEFIDLFNCLQQTGDECDSGNSGPPGDIDHNGMVNVNDLLILIGAWGACPTPPNPPQSCPADLNGSGVVDVNDLLILIEHWG